MTLAGSEFEAFVAARGAALMRTAYVLTADRHLAEDLLQSALAKAASRWHRLDDPEAYVRRSLYTEHVSWWRRRRHVTEVALQPGDGSSVEGPEVGVLDREVLRAALLRLTPKQRAVVVLRFYEDLSEAQAADVLGVSVGTVKSQTSAALKRLRTVVPELSPAAARTEGDR